jgi:hypothetical protein
VNIAALLHSEASACTTYHTIGRFLFFILNLESSGLAFEQKQKSEAHGTIREFTGSD